MLSRDGSTSWRGTFFWSRIVLLHAGVAILLVGSLTAAQVAETAVDLVPASAATTTIPGGGASKANLAANVRGSLVARCTDGSLVKLRLLDAKIPLNLLMLRIISDGSDDDAQSKEVLPDPGLLNGYQAKVGKTFYFRVTGAAANRNGSLDP